MKLIADELKDYPQIDFRWREVGLSFQVQFVKLDYLAEQERKKELGQELQQELHKRTLYSEILQSLIAGPLSRQEISGVLRQKRVSGQLNKVVQKLVADRLVERNYP